MVVLLIPETLLFCFSLSLQRERERERDYLETVPDRIVKKAKRWKIGCHQLIQLCCAVAAKTLAEFFFYFILFLVGGGLKGRFGTK